MIIGAIMVSGLVVWCVVGSTLPLLPCLLAAWAVWTVAGALSGKK